MKKAKIRTTKLLMLRRLLTKITPNRNEISRYSGAKNKRMRKIRTHKKKLRRLKIKVQSRGQNLRRKNPKKAKRIQRTARPGCFRMQFRASLSPKRTFM